jgi:hypothetical protein
MADGIIRMDAGWRLDQGHHFDQPPNGPALPPAPVIRTRRKGERTMDYIPNKRADQYLWWKNLSDNLAVEGPKMGLAPAAVTAAKAIADDQVAKLEATDAAKSALDGARAAEATASRTNETAIRGWVRNWKTLPAFPASGSEGVLRLIGGADSFDPNTVKAGLKVTVVGGQVRLDFIKNGVDAVNIYARLRGTQGWTKLALDSTSPYIDTRPLSVPGVPEVREYLARCVVDDDEVGLDSDIVSVVFSN